MTDPSISRRQLIQLGGALAAAAITPPALAAAPATAPKALPAPPPWPYVKLDPDRTAELAYAEFFRVYCGAGIISSVFSQLREKTGGPYLSFPVDAFTILGAGVAGWGTLCGALSGAGVVLGVVVGPGHAEQGVARELRSALMQWYSEESLPTFVPASPRLAATIPPSRSESPLCHLSLGRWTKLAGKDVLAPESAERCARLTASVACRLVRVLNDWKDGKPVAAGPNPLQLYRIPSQANCTDCHGRAVPTRLAPPPKGT